MSFEHTPFGLDPMFEVMAVLMTTLTIELVGKCLNLLSHLFRPRMFWLGCWSIAGVVLFLRHDALPWVNRTTEILCTSYQWSPT
jgi:hypothetical protein